MLSDQGKGRGSSDGVLPRGSQPNCRLICCNSCSQTGEPWTLASSCLRCSQNCPIDTPMGLGYNSCSCFVNSHTLSFHSHCQPGGKLRREHVSSRKTPLSAELASPRGPSSSKKLLFILFLFYFRYPYKNKSPALRAGIWTFLAGTPALGKHI